MRKKVILTFLFTIILILSPDVTSYCQMALLKTTGNVSDMNGNAIAGASVWQVGYYSKGVVTDASGNYTLPTYTSKNGIEIYCYYTGYEEAHKKRKAGPILNFVLVEIDETLSEPYKVPLFFNENTADRHRPVRLVEQK